MSTTLTNENNTFEKVWEMFAAQTKEADRQRDSINKQLKELGKQIGGLGNKFGTFNEGLVLPSLKKFFLNEFKCKFVSENFFFNSNGDPMELDLLAVSEDSCYIIEIKSHLKSQAIEQIHKQIDMFKKLAKIYSDKKVFGVIVATHYSKETLNELYKNGIYFISISDDIVKLKIPESFNAKAW